MLAGWRRCHTSSLIPAFKACGRRHSQAIACYSTSRSSSSEESSSDGLRQLMRKVAQPVAVITANLKHADRLNEPDHGATISSFVSIALHPTPLVAFALRLPSRLATFLNAQQQASSSSSSSSSSSDHVPPATFKIHLLSEEQEDVARAFARQAPLPSKAMPSPSNPQIHDPFPPELFAKLEATSLGSLECSLAGDIPLVEPLFSQQNNVGSEGQVKASKVGQATSQLFIAKVIKANQGDATRHPLLYYHQKYCVLDME